MTDLLLLDLGNRHLKAARSSSAGQWSPLSLQEGELAAAIKEFGNAWISSTRPQRLQELQANLAQPEGLRVVTAQQVPLPRVTTGTGSDRLLAALAATHIAPGEALLIADLGTAWTLDLVDATGVFRGGAIGAGLGVQVTALAQACPHLAPPATDHESTVPTHTAAAVAAGTRQALAQALQGLALQWEQNLERPARRFLCGADAATLEPWLKGWQRRSNMVLEGLSWVAHEPVGEA